MFYILDLTFKFFSLIFSFVAFANIENENWILHLEKKDISFKVFNEKRGIPFVTLKQIAEKTDLQVKEESEELTLQSADKKRSVKINKKTGVVSFSTGSKRQLSHYPVKENDAWLLPIDFADRGLLFVIENRISAEPNLKPQFKDIDILLDPGHGGNDWGAHSLHQRHLIKEKDVVLGLALDLRDSLRSRGIQAELTRKEDTFLTLTERVIIAQKTKPKAFVSLHLNSSMSEKARGYEIYLLSIKNESAESRRSVAEEYQQIPKDLPLGLDKVLLDFKAEANFEKSLELAKTTHEAMQLHLKPFGKPIKMGPFFVLYGVDAPSILLEWAFLSHPKDRLFLGDSAKMNASVDSVSKNLANYLKIKKIGDSAPKSTYK